MDDQSDSDTSGRLPKAVVFDLDGTLIISSVNFPKFRARLLEFMKEKGADMSQYSKGETTVSMITKFEAEMRGKKGSTEEQIEKYLDEIDSILNEIELERIDETEPVPGVFELLEELRSRGIKIGVLTRGCAEYAEKAIDIAGLSGHLDAVVPRDRGSGVAPKPDPEAALHISLLLKVPLDEMVMVGDHSIDYAGAKNANVRFVGIVSDERSLEDLRECGCPEIIRDLKELLDRLGL